MATNIEIDDFDKEYSLNDLIKIRTLEEIFKAESISGIEARITSPDGKVFFETLNFPKNIDENEGIPISHEAEIIAHFFLRTEKGSDNKQMANLAALFMEKMIGFQKKVLMTSGLHGKIVESSYEELMEKNRSLEESEEKYRHLAENLEMEVRTKTEEIKKTLAVLMQKEKLASIGSLAAGMAHEINNPLGFIMSNLKTLGEYLDDLVSGGTDPKEMDYIRQDSKDILSETSEGLNRIQKIVSDLKSFSAIDAPEKTSADINSCIDSCLGITGDLTGTRIKIIKKYGNLPKTIIDVGKINQMFMSIIMNSIQAINDKGSITFETSHIKQGKGYIKTVITDTGQGISPENLKKAFDPFFTTRDVGEGMGLGLTTARETARMHGGEIILENRPDRGVSCTIIIAIKD